MRGDPPHPDCGVYHRAALCADPLAIRPLPAGGERQNYAAATVKLAPSACPLFPRLPAGVSGPATRQIVSSIRTVPEPSMIGFSSVNTRPISASARLLRNGLLAPALPESARRRHSG